MKTVLRPKNLILRQIGIILTPKNLFCSETVFLCFDCTKVRTQTEFGQELNLFIFRVSNTAQNSVQLSNFSTKSAGYCRYSQDYNSRQIEQDSGKVIVLKFNQIKECKWVSFNGTFTKIPGILFLNGQRSRAWDLTNINLYVLLETKYMNIRATIDHRTTTGFKVCAFAT